MGNGMNKILPGLYLGNYRDSKDPAQLSKYNITHIVSVHESSKPILPDKKYLCLVASDVSTQNLSQFFAEANDFIHEARCNGGNVLVHCLAGVSRSTTIVIAYLMTVSKLAWKECLGAVQQNRPCANPNFGFQRQLLEFQYDNVLEEHDRLLERFPQTRELMEQDRDVVQEFYKVHKQVQHERAKLRSEFANSLCSMQSGPTTSGGDNDCSYFFNESNGDVDVLHDGSTNDSTATSSNCSEQSKMSSTDEKECSEVVKAGGNMKVVEESQQPTMQSQPQATTATSSSPQDTSIATNSSSPFNPCNMTSCSAIKQNLDYLLDSTVTNVVDCDKK